jgi:hypothetical protein
MITAVQQTEKSLTKDMRAAQRDNTCGGRLEGMEFRLKGEDRLKEKLAEELGITPAMKSEHAIQKINDAIRYTFRLAADRYADGYWDIKQQLESREFRMVYSRNYWRDDTEYKGVNTRWVTPQDQQFEVQFHTPESLHAKQEVTHRSYERIRDPQTPDDERGALEAFQRDVCSRIVVPEGARDIPDYRRKGR